MADYPQDRRGRLPSVVSCRTSPNIAVIKYWGKANENDVIPLNDSISVTLQSEKLQTETSVFVGQNVDTEDSMQEDALFVNGEKSSLNRRTTGLLAVLRNKSDLEPELKNRPLVIVSRNNFPTASGMASSASGFAALAHALCHYFKVSDIPVCKVSHKQIDGDWSIYARMGSGSACRSMFGGFVHWQRGTGCDDSRAVQLFNECHWPQLRVLILVFSSKQKTVSSTAAMKRSVETSSFLKQRIKSIEEENLVERLRCAISEKDFETFGRMCMTESNQLHAVCMDTYPPVHYLTDESRLLINAIHELNTKCNRTIAAYTFDAGPNAFIFYQEADRLELYAWLQRIFPTCNLLRDQSEEDSNASFGKNSSSDKAIPHIECTVGPGPTLLPDSVA